MPAQFAPELYIPNGVKDISFYTDGLGAQELRRFSNDDGSIHVAELVIDGSMFHLHEITANRLFSAPSAAGSTTVIIGLFTENVQEFVDRALAAGAELLSPVTDYDYGYRQGQFKDPFGHVWMIQKKIG
ncbi:MAG: VOC family protein [Chitinophagaceae bacterium]|nr:VOC family protein [Chitinophagaceae bacterium]